MGLTDVVAVLRADSSQFTAKLGEARAELDKLGTSGASSFEKLASVGKAATAAIAIGVGVAAVASIKMAADFQTSMTQLVTGAGESEKNIKMVGNGILALAGPMGTTTQQLSSGMYMIESAGYHGAAGLSVLKAAAEGAKVGNADLGVVADAVTTALNDYHLPAAQAAEVTSKLVATVASGKTHMEDLAGSLAKVMPAASAAGVGLDQVLGAMATMTSEGTPAAMAATYLRSTILNLANPTAKAADEMKSLGLSSIDISSNLGKRGLTGTLDILTTAIQSKMGPAGTVMIESLKKASGSTTDFQKVLANLPPAQQTYVGALADMVGGTKSMQAALELTGSNAATFNTNVKNIGATTTEAGGNVKGFALIHKDLNFQMDQAKNTVQALGIRLGEALIPKLESAMKAVEKLVIWFEKHKSAAEALGIAVGTVLVAAIVAAGVAFFAAFGWVELIVIAIAALVVGIIYLATHWKQVWGDIKNWFDDAVSFLRSGFATLGLLILGPIGVLAILALHWQAIWSSIRAVVNDVWHSIDNDVLHPLESFFKMFSPVIDAFRAAWNVAWTVISGALTIAWDIMKPVFNFIKTLGFDVIKVEIIAFQAVWNAVWPVISTALSIAWDVMKVIFKAIEIIAIIPLGLAVLAFQALWNVAWEAISAFLSAAWDVMKPVFGFISTVGINIVKGDITAFQAVWNAVWPIVSAALSAAWDVMKPVFGFIKTLGTDVIKVEISALQTVWNAVWPVVSAALSAAWSIMQPVFGFIKTVGIDVISNSINGLETIWNIVWSGLNTAISGAWSLMQPVFGFIKGAINDVIGVINDLINAYNAIPLLPNVATISKIGSSFPTLPGGAQGPVVPGHALGGAVTANMASIVGEKGPELFVPGVNGSIIPNNALNTAGSASSPGATTTIDYNPSYYISGAADASSVAAWKVLQAAHDQELIRQLQAAR